MLYMLLCGLYLLCNVQLWDSIISFALFCSYKTVVLWNIAIATYSKFVFTIATCGIRNYSTTATHPAPGF